MGHEGMMLVRAALVARIEALIQQCAEMRLAALSEELDVIRTTARCHGLQPVERLASLLASVIVYNGHRQIAHNYLSLMLDAATCIDDRPDVASAYLAAASLRGCHPRL